MDRSNLIVNYLPSDLGDDQLRVSLTYLNRSADVYVARGSKAPSVSENSASRACRPSETRLVWQDLFTEFGAIESARVIKERGSGKSLGYGFIKYQYPEDAEKAVLSRNGYALGGKRIKVSVARPASDDIKNCKLYVANLPQVSKGGEAAWGGVLCHWCGRPWGGVVCTVYPLESINRRQGLSISCGTVLYVLWQHYEKAEVVGMFCPFGRIIECRLLTDPSTGKSRNIAFVQYDSKQEATAGTTYSLDKVLDIDRRRRA